VLRGALAPGIGWNRSAMPTLALVRAGELIASYRLDKPVIVVGRSSECDITLGGPLVSRKHCRFVACGDAYAVEDMGSHNGTHLNGKRVERQTLVEGDRIAVVPHILVYHALDEEPVAAPALPRGDVSAGMMATAAVDITEVNRHLAGLHAEAAPRGFAVSHEAVGGGVDLVRISGPLDGRTSQELGKAIAELLAEGRCRIVVDMTEACNLTSDGVGVLLWAADRAETSGGKIVLLSPASQRQDMLDLGLARMFTMAGNRQEAVSILSPAR
jgi:anti-anti-sigma factor